MALAIFIMIGIGGYTRLSQSGLSMVEWKPVTGWLPPLDTEEWNDSFEKYRQHPEYKMVNMDMDLEGYKKIFYVEYFHRVFGRLLGFLFFIPFIYFLIKRKFTPKSFTMYLLIGCLGGVQGFVGWFMVQSGLIDRPAVSAYRLCAHLSLGGFLFWVCLYRYYKERYSPYHISFLWVSCILLTGLQISSGAFVSGSQAGHALPQITHMITATFWDSSLGWLNLFENLVTILLHHIVIGSITMATLIYYIKKQFKMNPMGAIWVASALGLQITLGLLTIMTYSPERNVFLCLAHQMGAFVLLASISASRFDKKAA